MQAFILAGGFATRLWPLTEKRAKPLLPIAGKPIITYIVEAIPENLPITVSTNAVFQPDFAHWKKTLSKPMTISIEDVGHEDQKLGALGAVAHWITEHAIDDDILLLAGDNFTSCDLSVFIAKFQGNPLVAGHDIGSKEAAKQFGTIITNTSDGELQSVTSFEEKPINPQSTIVSTGWWILPKSSLPILKTYAKTHPDNVGGIFEEFLRQNIPVDCMTFTDTWKDIGSFEAYLSLHQTLLGQLHMTHDTTTIDADSTLTGAIDLGPETIIQKSSLTDCILFGKTTVTDCVLERCIIDERCTLEGIDLSDKMLREGTILRRR